MVQICFHTNKRTWLINSSSSDEMKTFAGQQIEPLFQFSWLVVFLSLLFCGSVAVVLGFTVDPNLSLAVSLSLLALLYLFFGASAVSLRRFPFQRWYS